MLVLVVVCTVAASTSAASRSGASQGHISRVRQRCVPKRSQILGRSGSSVLFRQITGPDDGKYGAPHSLFGCRNARQTPLDLFDFEDGDIPSVVLTSFNGSYAAYFLGWEAATCVFYESAGAEHCGQSLFESVNLRTGHVRVSGAEESTGAVEPPKALVVSHDGWIAWIAPERSGTAPLMAQDSTGRRTLDPGPIDTRSLRMSGKKVRWTDAGVAHSAVLAR